MHKIKRMLVTAGATAALAIGMAGTAGATGQVNVCGSTNVGSGSSGSVACDNSVDNSVTLGNCSAIIKNYVDQYQSNSNHQAQVSGNNTLVDDHNSNSSQSSQSNSTDQGQSVTITFSPNCSVTNITQAAAAPAGGLGGGEAPQVAVASSLSGGRGAGEVAQVSATPSGGVGAGAGGAAQSSAAAVAGLSSSLGVLGLGLRLRNGFQL